MRSGLGRTLLALLPPGLFAVGGWLAWGGLIDGALIGAVAWLALRLGPVRMGLLRDHLHGMSASRDDAWAEALAAFEASEAAWAGRQGLDRWRAPLLGSSGPWPYRVLARYNQALCLVQLGRLDEARARLDTLLAEHPGMAPARELRGALAAGWTGEPRPAAPVEQPGDWFEE